MGHGQCDQIVLHFKGLCDNFFKKVAQTESDILGYFENHLKLAMTTFWARIGKIWLLFILPSGHTGHGPKKLE